MAKHSDLVASTGKKTTRTRARKASVPGDTAAERDAARRNSHAVDTAARTEGWTEVEIPELESNPPWKWREDGDTCVGRLHDVTTANVADFEGGGKVKRTVLTVEVDGEMRALFLPAFYEPHVRKGLRKIVRVERTGEGREDTRYTFAYRAK